MTTTTQQAGGDVVRVFDDAGDFKALRAAEAWCRDHGVSYGPTDRTGKLALMAGDYMIAKWHNLTLKEQAESHGTLSGDFRNGPLTLRIDAAALIRAGSP